MRRAVKSLLWVWLACLFGYLLAGQIEGQKQVTRLTAELESCQGKGGLK